MDIKAVLKKPYTQSEREKFIIENRYINGFKIEYVDDEIYAGTLTEEELLSDKNERLAMLSLTAADVERAIYKVKGLDFDDIIILVSQNSPENLDIKALKIELKANHFYRGNPYVDVIGAFLGFTKEQLDKFFETGNYNYLF